MYKSACLFTLYGFKYLFCGEFCYYSPPSDKLLVLFAWQVKRGRKVRRLFQTGNRSRVCREHPLSATVCTYTNCVDLLTVVGWFLVSALLWAAGEAVQQPDFLIENAAHHAQLCRLHSDQRREKAAFDPQNRRQNAALQPQHGFQEAAFEADFLAEYWAKVGKAAGAKIDGRRWRPVGRPRLGCSPIWRPASSCSDAAKKIP